MKISKSTLQSAFEPTVANALIALFQNATRAVLGAETIGAITDNSTGVAAGTLAAVPVVPTKGEGDGSNLAPRAAFNTAIGKVDNAINVLAKYLNDEVLTPLSMPTITLNGGTVAVPGTVPALDKALTATDGSTNTAMLRSEAFAQLSIARNNLATVVKAYNMIATAIGGTTLADNTGGKADSELELVTQGTAATAVATADVATTDCALDTEVDASLTALANNIATLAAKIGTSLLASGNISARVPVLIVQ